MRPLKPIKQAQHNSKYAQDKKHIPGRLYISEPEYTGGKLKPLVVETADESIVRADALSRKFKDLVGASHKSNGLLHLSTAMYGALGEGLASLFDAISSEGIEVVIINSWEWGAFTSSEKHYLFKVIRELSSASDLCVIIFSSASAKSLMPGFRRQGLLGMLSFISDVQIDIRTENELLPAMYEGNLTPPEEEVKPVYMTAPKEKKDESKHIGRIKINDLGEVVGTSLVSDGHLVPA